MSIGGKGAHDVDRGSWIVDRRMANHASRTTERGNLFFDGSGQALAFGAMTFFLMTCFVAFTLNVGQVSARKIQVQNAADQGAYAGAATLANVLSDIAWLNDAQAHLYYHAMRQAVDVTVYGVLKEISLHGSTDPLDDMPFPDDAIVDGSGDGNVSGLVIPSTTWTARYDDAYQEAMTWFPRYAEWTRRMGQMQWGMAAVGPALVKREIWNAVYRSMGRDPAAPDTDLQVALFPDFRLLPDPDGYYRLDITRYQQDPAGWMLSDSNGFWVRALILDPDEWSVQSSTGLDLVVAHPLPTRYVLTLMPGPQVMTFDFHDGLGWVLQMPDFTIQPGPHGGYEISGPGGTEEFRRGPDGQLQQWSGGGWTDLGGGTVTVDGVEIPIHQDDIQIAGNPPTTVHLDPLWITFGNIRITPTPGKIRIEGQFGPAWVTVDDDYVVCNTLSTKTADNLWHRWQGDRIRHRMSTTPSPDDWIYEWKRIGAYLQNEPSGERFGWTRAIGDNNPSGLTPLWAYSAAANPLGWFDPGTGVSLDPKAYSQTRTCWHPKDHVCPVHGGGCPGDPSTGLAAGVDGGWHEIAGGVPVWVSCPTCAGGGAGDFLDDDLDGRSDVRKYQANITPPGYINPSPHYESARITNFPQLFAARGPNVPDELRMSRPLVLTEDFFRYGINVAVVKRGASGGSGEEFNLIPERFPNEPQRVGVASAKCGVRDTAAGTYRYRFLTAQQRADWVNLDGENLYVADWEARLWSVRDAVLDADIDADVVAGDTGLTYLFRGLRDTAWLTAYDDVNPVWGYGGNLGIDASDPALKDVVRH